MKRVEMIEEYLHDENGDYMWHDNHGILVRCKDCKWFNDIGCSIRIVDDSDKPTENDYCSFGERNDV